MIAGGADESSVVPCGGCGEPMVEFYGGEGQYHHGYRCNNPNCEKRGMTVEPISRQSSEEMAS